MKKLYRSTRDKKVLGLCGGLAEMLNIDATLLRVLFIVAVIFSSGTLILIYILAGLVVPKEPPYYNGFGSGFGGYGNTPYGSDNTTNNQGYYNPGFGPGPTNQASANWPPPQATNPVKPAGSNLDQMMEDIEKKALRRELDELRAKLAKYEKEDQ